MRLPKLLAAAVLAACSGWMSDLSAQNWLENSFRHHTVAEDGLGYGYQWWLSGRDWDTAPWRAGFGNGGQRLVVLPGPGLVVVIMAGNYNQRGAWKLSVAIMRDILMPDLNAD